jgi:hypothetical protein
MNDHAHEIIRLRARKSRPRKWRKLILRKPTSSNGSTTISRKKKITVCQFNEGDISAARQARLEVAKDPILANLGYGL